MLAKTNISAFIRESSNMLFLQSASYRYGIKEKHLLASSYLVHLEKVIREF